MRKSFPVMVFWGKGRQMERDDISGSANDWRQAWRAFADKVSARPSDTYSGATPMLGRRLQEVREGPFEGFDSPPGKF
jgi:hypothetical protein